MNYGPNIIKNNLLLCLDAADRNSYPGSGNTWYDLSGNNIDFTLGCAGASCTNPSFSNNAIKTSFTQSIDNYATCSNYNATVKGLLYGDHTIEVACKINSLTRGIDLNAAYTTETQTTILGWKGFNAGLTLSNANLNIYIWNGTTNVVGAFTAITSYVGSNLVIHATRIVDTLYIYLNGILVKTQAITAPAVYNYSSLTLGATTPNKVISDNSYALPSNIDFYAVKLYTMGFTQSQVTQNFNASRSRFGI